MEHDDSAFRQGAQRPDHCGEIHAVACRIVIRIGIDFETRVLEQRPVVLPARLADPYVGARRKAAQEVGTELEASGTAQRLDRHNALFLQRRALGAKDQNLHRRVVGSQTVYGQISARRGSLDQLALGAAHAFENRHLAGVVIVDADAEVDLVRIGVGVECLGDAENRVAWRRRHLGKQM